MTHKSKGALALTLTGLLAINVSFADDVAQSAATQTVQTESDQTSRELAKEANETAARQAVEAVLTEVKLDLDIRLIGPTSVTIAADR